MIQFHETDERNRTYRIDIWHVHYSTPAGQTSYPPPLHENDKSLFNTHIEWIKHKLKSSNRRSCGISVLFHSNPHVFMDRRS